MAFFFFSKQITYNVPISIVSTDTFNAIILAYVKLHVVAGLIGICLCSGTAIQRSGVRLANMTAVRSLLGWKLS